MILKYVLSKGRGLCSTLNSLLGMAHLCTEKNQIKINIDSSKCLIFKELSFFDTFKPNDIFVNQPPGKSIIKESLARRYAWERYFNASKKNCTNFRLVLQDEISSEVNSKISNLNLPTPLACLHIRRGDKTERESRFFSFEEYLNKVPSEINDIFIMSDDYKSIQEAKKYLQKSNVSKKLYYLTESKQQGRFESQNLITKKPDLIKFLTEIEIAKKCEIFIGDKQSNVYVYISRSCEKHTECISL